MNKRIALSVFLLAFLVRLVAGWPMLRTPALASGHDAIGYHELAAALWQGRFPSLFRTPGYPLFLALTGATTSEHVVVALLLQMLLDSLTAVLVCALAWRWWQSEGTALVAGLLYAVCAVAAVNTRYIGNEPQAVFLVVVALWLAGRNHSWWNIVAQAVLWFAATMTRPSYALLPVVVSVFLLWRMWQKSYLQRQVVMLCLYGLLTGAWVGFNYARAGMPVLSSNPDVSFYIYDTAALRMAQRISLGSYIRLALLDPPEFDRQLELYQLAYTVEEQTSWRSSATDLWLTKDDPALIQTLRAEAVQKTKEHLPLLLGIHLTGVGQSLRPMWNSVGWFFRTLDGVRMLLLPLAVWVILWRRQWWLVAFFAVWSAYALLPPGPVGAWRFRSLIEPFVSLILASALLLAMQWTRQHTMALMLHLETNLTEQQEAETMSK
jgi:hypothetical protein